MDIKLENLSIFEFSEKFGEESACYEYLAELKWGGREFECRRCKNTNACKGNGLYTKKCTRCHYQESVTAHTLFHRCRFPMVKAFYIIYFVSTTKGGISALELSRKLNLRAKTCWLFKRKVMAAMASSKVHPMEGDVEVDEFVVGAKEEGVTGRQSGRKKKVAIAVEKKGKGVSRIYARVIKDYSKCSILPFIQDHISPAAIVKTDGWSAYKAMKKEFPYHTSELSDGGNNFLQLHRCIMMIKAWLRGVHHSVQDLQPYLDEYCYRYNRHLMKKGIFENLTQRMMLHKPLPYKNIMYA
jgi:transposase-like protein